MRGFAFGWATHFFILGVFLVNKKKTCCFLGHRKITETDNMKLKLYEILERLITDENAGTFLFGSKSEFDTLCLKTVSKLKEKYPQIIRVYVRAEYPYITAEYENYLLQFYEITYFPDNAINAGRAVYVERNYEMINKSDICIFYYNKLYSPSQKTKNKENLLDFQKKSGTGIAYMYAERKDKKIINMFNII